MLGSAMFQKFSIYSTSVPYKRKKVQNFFRHFRTEVLRNPAFFLPPKTGVFVSRQKPAFLFPAKNRSQLRFAAPRSGMSHKSRRKLAELRRRHTCQLSRFRRETPDFEDFSRSPDLNKKSPDITI